MAHEETTSTHGDGSGEPSLSGDRDLRRKLLAGMAAGTAVWAAPAITRVSSAQAQSSNLVIETATTDLGKWSANPPTVDEVCSAGPTGAASRGSVDFELTCSPLPRTITITIIVTSGPSLDGANQRDVRLLQSDANGCLDDSSIGIYNSPNNTVVTLGPLPVLAGATHFAIAMLETGGGGTDLYTTGRVEIICP